MTITRDHHIIGCLTGLMVGDSIGLPYEGIGKKRQSSLLPPPLRHRLFFGKGMISDDTEHAVMTAVALAQNWGDPVKFQKNLLWRLRWWIFRLPAGIGMATGRALLKAWIGFSAKRCGVFSAGNGPAMRAPILGVCLGKDPNSMKEYVKLSTKLTHTDPKALVGALAIAQASYLASQLSTVYFDDYLATLSPLLSSIDNDATEEFMRLLGQIQISLNSDEDEGTFAQKLGCEKGITGYMYHTVPMVIFIWFRYQGDYKTSIEKIIACGGDTDTTAAILGGICGTQNGKTAIPTEWLNSIVDYPFTSQYCEYIGAKLNDRLSGKSTSKIHLLPGHVILIRNFIFLIIVLFHGLRRLMPPY